MTETISSYTTKGAIYVGNPWGYNSYDKLDIRSQYMNSDDYSKYKGLVKDCRFFYKHDPLASTTINKLIDIGITPIIIDQGTLSKSDYQVIKTLTDKIQRFVEDAALEYLISGLVVPEVTYKEYGRRELIYKGIKRYSTLTLPDNMFIRDSAAVKIEQSMLSDEPSYFIKIPDDIVFFIQSKGHYPDGTEDREMYDKMAMYYPEVIEQVKKGKAFIPLENKYIIRGKHLSDSPYPIPYLYPALESLKHKRNIRRMDYSIAARVTNAIQHVTIGNDEFPVVEGDEDQFDTIREQMKHQPSYSSYNGEEDVERIIQLFTNHTVNIKWIFPDVDALLSDSKYSEVNQDIIFALGFPRILITGEAARTGTSEPQYATLSPTKTMESIQRKLLPLVERIVLDTIELNGFRGVPSSIRFDKINLHDFRDFSSALIELYNSGNLSRESYAEFFGFNIKEEFSKRKAENELLEQMELSEFGPLPYSPKPDTPNSKTEETDTQEAVEE